MLGFFGLGDSQMAENHNRRGTILTFALGVGVGAAAALLFAPKAGEELRDDISESISGGVDQVRSKARDLKQKAQRFVDLAKDHVDQAIEAGDSAYNQAKRT
jgi:gas vesicle protein